MNTAPSTILVVDDEPRGRQLLEELLTPHGYRLLFASNGQEALALATAHTPDLVLLDVMMPGVDGFEVCRRLRANPQLREIPVIMLTALDDRESRLQGLAAGADNFLTKPFDQIELRTRVATITRLNRYRLLLAERERFAQAIDGAPDGILIVDDSFQIRLANPAAQQMFRAEATRPLLDEPLAKRVSLDAAVLEQLKELMRGGLAPFQFVANGLQPNSVRFPIEASASRLPGRINRRCKSTCATSPRSDSWRSSFSGSSGCRGWAPWRAGSPTI